MQPQRSPTFAAGYAQSVGAIALLCGLLVGSGWALGAPMLTTLMPGWPPMMPMTALALALCGAGLGLAGPHAYGSPARRRAVMAFGALAVLLGISRLAAHLLGWNLWGDRTWPLPLSTLHLTAASEAAALGCVLMGGALAVRYSPRSAVLYRTLAVLTLLVAWLDIARNLYGDATPVTAPPVGLPTALIQLMLATALFTLRRGPALGRLIAAKESAGISARWLFPAALVSPLTIAVVLCAERLGVLQAPQGYAIAALLGALVFAATAWVIAEQLARMDAVQDSPIAAPDAAAEASRLLVKFSDDAILTKTLSGVITSWNPSAEKLFGYTAQQAIGQSMQMLIPPERFAEEAEILSRIGSGEQVRHFETVRMRADGTLIDISATISPVKDQSGRIIGASKIARNITERRIHERTLLAQLERLTLLQQVTRAITGRHDLQSIFEVTLHSLEQHLPIDFGLIALCDSAREVVTVTCIGAASRPLATQLGLANDSSIDVDQDGLARCMQGQLVYEQDISTLAFPFTARLSRGGLHALVIAPLIVDDRVLGMMMSARRSAASFSTTDCEFLLHLSEQLALAANQAQLHTSLQRAYEDLRLTQESVMQEERVRALGQMASGIAHDINNALSPAFLYTQSLLERDQSLGTEAREYLIVIQQAIEDVSRTVARLRRFYSPRDAELTPVLIDLGALMQQAAELTRARWRDMPQERGILVEFKSEFALGLPPVMGAANEIRDAVTNLIFNAVDAMPEGGTLTLRTTVRPIAAANRELRYSVCAEVCDTGTGMTEATRSRCLEPFFTTKGTRGTGLGLAMVYGMVQRHGARLEIESQPDWGTTIRLVFPAAALEGERQAVAPTAPQASLRILLVDDDPVLLRSLQNVFEADGHIVTAENGGQNGIDAFRASRARHDTHFDIVVTDLGMPGVDGRAVAAAIKSAAPGTPVVLLTGWGPRLQGETALPLHVDCVLSKPPLIADLRITLAMLTVDSRLPPASTPAPS
jgi:PAS domain S-box-containing protein